MSQGNLDTSHRACCGASPVPWTSPTDPTMGPNATSVASRCEAEQPAMRRTSGRALTDPPCSTPTPIASRPARRKNRCFMLLGEGPPSRHWRRRSPESRDAESCGPAHRRAQGSPGGDPAGAAARRWCGAAPTTGDLCHMIGHHRPVSIHHLHQLQHPPCPCPRALPPHRRVRRRPRKATCHGDAERDLSRRSGTRSRIRFRARPAGATTALPQRRRPERANCPAPPARPARPRRGAPA